MLKKDIYIIKNSINDKVYIGQSVDTKIRFQEHCKPSSAKHDKSLIASAIQKYGRENFWYEVLELQIENYNDREKYWIEQLNSIAPNGYNLLSGGDEPPLLKGCDAKNAVLSQSDVENLTLELKDGKETLTALAKKYNFQSVTSISEFNLGQTYRRDINYPIRKDVLIGQGKLSHSDVEEISIILKTSYRSYGDIASQFGVEYKAIMRINKGLLHKRDSEEYPLREGQLGSIPPKFSYEQVTEIIFLLQNTSLSLREIARKFNDKYENILNIKNGTTKIYRRRGLTYPLRPNN